jgi:hypothetical protein
MTMDEKMLDIKEFARQTSYSERYIRQLCIDGEIEGATKLFNKGGKWLIPASALQKLKPSINDLIPDAKPHDQGLFQDSSPKLPVDLVNKEQEKHWHEVEKQFIALRQPLIELGGTTDVDSSGKVTYMCVSYPQDFTEVLHRHLADLLFWQNVNEYNEIASKASCICKELTQEIMKTATALAPFENEWDYQEKYVTWFFICSVIDISLGKVIPWMPKYKWDEQNQVQTYQAIYISKGFQSEIEHRALVDTYSKDERIKCLGEMINNLERLKGEILTRLQTAIAEEEYKYSFCSKCPLVRSGHIKL